MTLFTYNLDTKKMIIFVWFLIQWKMRETRNKDCADAVAVAVTVTVTARAKLDEVGHYCKTKIDPSKLISVRSIYEKLSWMSNFTRVNMSSSNISPYEANAQC